VISPQLIWTALVGLVQREQHETIQYLREENRKWSSAVRQLLEASGMQMVQTPFRAPNFPHTNQ
jgi:hypothetical protein